MATLTDLPAETDALPGGHESPAEAAEDDEKELTEIAAELWQIVTRVSAEEFRWQESHYDSDSRRGRELLFLIANNEWVRATSEIIDISRSDSIETTIKIDVDLDRVTHEAFRNRTGRFWLPVIVLPPPAGSEVRPESDPRRLEPDPFATVTDAAGNLMPIGCFGAGWGARVRPAAPNARPTPGPTAEWCRAAQRTSWPMGTSAARAWLRTWKKAGPNCSDC